MSGYNICEHILIDGHRCGSPALRGDTHCHHHQRYKRPFIVPGEKHYEMPSLDHPLGRARLLHDILRGIGSGQMELKTARTMLHAVNMAMQNSAPRKGLLSRGPTRRRADHSLPS